MNKSGCLKTQTGGIVLGFLIIGNQQRKFKGDRLESLRNDFTSYSTRVNCDFTGNFEHGRIGNSISVKIIKALNIKCVTYN